MHVLLNVFMLLISNTLAGVVADEVCVLSESQRSIEPHSSETVEEIDYFHCPDQGGNESHDLRNCNRNTNSSSINFVGVNDNGKLTVTYFLKEYMFGKINFELFVNDNLPNSKCNQDHINNTSGWLAHSYKYININNRSYDENSNTSLDKKICSKEITVTFDSVYSSCYFVRVIPCTKSLKNLVTSCPKMVNSTYKKESLTFNSFISSQCLSEENGFCFTFTIDEPIQYAPKAIFSITKVGNDNPIMVIHNEADNSNSTLENYSDNTNNICSYKWNKGLKIFQRTCSLYDVTEGEYRLKLNYYDLRCRSNTVWSQDPLINKCSWQDSIYINCTRTYKVETSYKSNDTSVRFIIYFAIFLILIVVITTGVIYFFPYKIKKLIGYSQSYGSPGSSDNSFDLTPQSSQYFTAQTEIFLIYPRDCEKFNNVINKFKKVMRKYYFQIYDFWEDDCARSVSYYGGQGWVDRNIEKSKYAIVVESDCAIELERRNILGLIGEQYCDPQYLDQLFIYAIHSLKHRMISENKKVYLVRLDDSVNREERLKTFYLCPSCHFLPSQLNALITDLNRLDRISEVEGLSESQEYAEFIEAVNLFKEYVIEDPNYLKKLLHYQ